MDEKNYLRAVAAVFSLYRDIEADLTITRHLWPFTKPPLYEPNNAGLRLAQIGFYHSLAADI